MADKDDEVTLMSFDDIVDLEALMAEDENTDISQSDDELTNVSEENAAESKEQNEETQNTTADDQSDIKEKDEGNHLPIESIYDSIVTVEDTKEKKKKRKKDDGSNKSGPKDDAGDPVDNKEDRRAQRQKRRKRSRIIAFLIAFILLVAIGVGIYYGINAAVDVLDNIETETVVDEPEVFVEEEIPTPVVDMTPEIAEETETEEVIEEPVEEVVEQSDEELLDEMVRSMIEEMTLEEKVAGLFIVSPENLTGQNNVTKAGEGTKAALEKYPIGGIIYSKQNVKTADQLKEMVENTVSYNRYPMFIGITEESGSESKLAALKVEKTLSAKELGAEGDSGVVYDTYSVIGNYLVENGFNLDFAPVADVMSGNNNRSFSDDPNTVANLVGGAIGGLKAAGVYSCAKSFPGMGYVNGDPTKTLASTERTKAEMEESELVPFKIAIETGVDMIMVGHFSAPAVTEDNMPCSMSKAIMTDLLRYEMNFDGVIITDACNVASITQYYSADEVAIKALKAGADMILLPENFTLAFDGVIAAVNDGTIDERRINDSLARVYKVKYGDMLEK